MGTKPSNTKTSEKTYALSEFLMSVSEARERALHSNLALNLQFFSLKIEVFSDPREN